MNVIAKKSGRININNVAGIHYNHSCLILPTCVWVYGAMNKMFFPLLILSISDFSIVGKSILNSEEFLLLPWVLEPLCGLISGPSLSLLMCLTPFSIFLQLLCSLFILFFFLLSWAHAITTLMSDLLENLTLHFYCLFECNDDSPVRQLRCIVYLYSCSRRLKRHDLMNQHLPSFSCLKKYCCSMF